MRLLCSMLAYYEVICSMQGLWDEVIMQYASLLIYLPAALLWFSANSDNYPLCPQQQAIQRLTSK